MDDRHDLSATPIGLSDTLDNEAVAYRPVSVIAVLGVVLALASPLALATRWLAPLPVAALILSWVAARKVQRDPEAHSGLGVAVTGLVIAAVVGGAVLAQKPFAQWLHRQTATAVADRFYTDLLAGDAIGAYELTLPLLERRPTPELAKLYYESDPQAMERLAEFTKREEVTRLAKRLTNKLLERSTGEVVTVSGGRLLTHITYALPKSADSRPETLSVRVERPASNRFGGVAWRVTDFGLSPTAD